MRKVANNLNVNKIQLCEFLNGLQISARNFCSKIQITNHYAVCFRIFQATISNISVYDPRIEIAKTVPHVWRN